MQKWLQSHGTTLTLAFLTLSLFFLIRPDDFPEILLTLFLVLILGGVAFIVRVLGRESSRHMSDEARVFILDKAKVVALMVSYGTVAIFIIALIVEKANTSREVSPEESLATAGAVLAIAAAAAGLHIFIEWLFNSLSDFIKLSKNEAEK